MLVESTKTIRQLHSKLPPNNKSVSQSYYRIHKNGRRESLLASGRKGLSIGSGKLRRVN
ncbi:hypothetical protein PZA11_000208 [Diplocarpon coronariae]